MRISVRVRPGASRTVVRGAYGDGTEPPLVVAVTARAVDGQATRAVLEAVAKAFGVRRHEVSLVAGATSRTKVVEVAGEESALRARLDTLLRS